MTFINTLIGTVAFAILAPIVGCLLAGLDRIISARMQGRVGPPLLQPYYDVRKLIDKDDVTVSGVDGVYMTCALVLWILLKCGVGLLPALGIALILPRAVLSVSRIFFARHIVKIDPTRFVRLVFVPLAICFAGSIAFCALFRQVAGGAVWWTVLCTGVNAALILTLAFRFHPAHEIRDMPGRILAKIRK